MCLRLSWRSQIGLPAPGNDIPAWLSRGSQIMCLIGWLQKLTHVLLAIAILLVYHILLSPGYASGTIAVNVTRLERGFNACKMPLCIYPSIFNHFWNIAIYQWRVIDFQQSREVNERFYHILFSPGYAPGTIAVNVTRLERGFNACQTPRCIYPSIFNRFWDVIGRKLRHFIPHLCLAAPQRVTPSEFREDLDTYKTRMNGVSCGEESMTICSAVLIQYQRVTDGRTDRQTELV